MGGVKIRRVKKLPPRPDAEVKKALIEAQRLKDVQGIHNSQRSKLTQIDELELFASLKRLEGRKLIFAVRENPPTVRIISSSDEALRHKAIVDGFAIWSPRDMFEYVHLPADQREKLRRFKKVFSDGGFEWEALKS